MAHIVEQRWSFTAIGSPLGRLDDPSNCRATTVRAVRDPLGLNERLFAIYYPRLLALAENAGQRETRRELIAHAEGRTLELGAGSGLNSTTTPTG